ncbi:hypothetical protein PBCVCan184_923L [Paramecium bursaria Chlorella virus Can18-4]|nr:hypothetical protein PBCVCan184_923L [Paramecium bursaria Chlorella virus Can18-4]
MFVKKYIDKKAANGATVYRVGVNHHVIFNDYPCLKNISPALCGREITNKTLQGELVSSPYVYKFPKVDIAIIGTHEDYFCYHFGRLLAEKVPYIAYPKVLQDNFGRVFNGTYEEMYDDGEYIIQHIK